MTSLTGIPQHAIPGTAEPGWPEVCAALQDLLPVCGTDDGTIDLQRLKSRVYRLRAGENGRARSFVLKRYDPWLARRNELVLSRWLPALRLGERSPRLLAACVPCRRAFISARTASCTRCGFTSAPKTDASSETSFAALPPRS